MGSWHFEFELSSIPQIENAALPPAPNKQQVSLASLSYRHALYEVFWIMREAEKPMMQF